MNRSILLVMAALLFVALGCNLDQFRGGSDDEVPTPVTDTANDADSDTTADADDGNDSDSTSSSSDGGSADVSMDKFDKIEMGMSYDAVKGIMGSDGNQTSMTKAGNREMASYEWKGEKFAAIRVRFNNDELSYKSQTGLTPANGSADISQAKFNRIEVGMSYDEVKDIIGSDGEMTSHSKFSTFESKSYRWKGSGYSNIFANFRDDKLQNKTQSNLK
ncbi:MAG: DUF3862 domain-containing protein [Acidobacteria bacterium]|nr:MAG: DUF3862 domain-containing protein [Acidobacteriota bacterium]REK02647.1 MAG: DUF3862 domain-containing protein [Acidobacteriota bacterium]REK13549.1 MAG: DUF3862 domain-containing protein [Acidobacteriota bacterium]REK41543.1 MAG: DUF3862 domain-containing protein [Acidobacteriota bacterium]